MVDYMSLKTLPPNLQQPNPPYFAHTAIRVPPPTDIYDRRLPINWLLASQATQGPLKPYPLPSWRIMVPYADHKIPYPLNLHSDSRTSPDSNSSSKIESEHISVETSDDSVDRPETEEPKKEKKKNPYSIEELLKKPEKMTNSGPMIQLRQNNSSMGESRESNRSSPSSLCSTQSEGFSKGVSLEIKAGN